MNVLRTISLSKPQQMVLPFSLVLDRVITPGRLITSNDRSRRPKKSLIKRETLLVLKAVKGR